MWKTWNRTENSLLFVSDTGMLTCYTMSESEYTWVRAGHFESASQGPHNETLTYTYSCISRVYSVRFPIFRCFWSTVRERLHTEKRKEK